jgi:glycosyltransferase involved in cell wall biosynthesis
MTNARVLTETQSVRPIPAEPDLAEIAAGAGLRCVHLLAWRDLDDREAGGSEVHASTIARLWAAAGVDVTMRTSAAVGHPGLSQRDGYQVVRRAGRYAIFPRVAVSGALGRGGRPDGLVEVWNGMPFFTPLWARCPRIVFLHHVHAEMWDMALSQPGLARLGKLVEFGLAPPLYRHSRVVTLSPSSREEIVARLGLPAPNITVAPPGVDARFAPGGRRSPHPLVAAVGRLVPVKQFDVLIESLVTLRVGHPTLEAVIAGEGYERDALVARVRAAGATGWLHLPGRLSDAELVALYRRAWVVTSASVREGWGMTLTEAAACGTPAVATAIPGHADAVRHGTSGLLASDRRGLISGLDAVLSQPALRRRLGRGALSRAASLTWEATARSTLATLAAEARRVHRGADTTAVLGPPRGRPGHPARPGRPSLHIAGAGAGDAGE